MIFPGVEDNMSENTEAIICFKIFWNMPSDFDKNSTKVQNKL